MQLTLGRRSDGSFSFVMTHGGLSAPAYVSIGARVRLYDLPLRLGVGHEATAKIVSRHGQKAILFDDRSDEGFLLGAIGVGISIKVIDPVPQRLALSWLAAMLRMRSIFA